MTRACCSCQSRYASMVVAPALERSLGAATATGAGAALPSAAGSDRSDGPRTAASCVSRVSASTS